MMRAGRTPPRSDEVISLRPVGAAPPEQAHRPFLLASLSMATLVGFVLGIHVSLDRLLDLGSARRSADLAQAHGQVQLLGFAGLFVMGMSLRLMPRFAGSRVAPQTLVPLTLGLFVVSLVTRAVFMPWFSGGVHSALWLGSAFGILLASASFLLVVSGTLTVDARRFEATSLAFVSGAWLLFFASTVSAVAAIDAVDSGSNSLAYLADNAVLQLELLGFLLSFILGVALRAIPTMVGIERPGRSASILAVAIAASVAILACSLLYLEYASYSRAAVRMADAAFLTLGLVLLALAWHAGVFRQAANRIRPASQTNLWLVRSAFVWLVVAALTMVYVGGSSFWAGELPGQFEFDAVRHALGVGVITMLIAGMSMMILPEFAEERLRRNRQQQLAFLLFGLLNVAAVLRVAPSLAGTSWTFDQRNLSMAIAGSFAEAALLIFTLYYLRLWWRTR